MSIKPGIQDIRVPRRARAEGVSRATVEISFASDEAPRRDHIPLGRALFHRGAHRPTRDLVDGSVHIDGLVRLGVTSTSGGEDIRVYPPPLPGERDEETRRRGKVPVVIGGERVNADTEIKAHQLAAEAAVKAYLRGVGKER